MARLFSIAVMLIAIVIAGLAPGMATAQKPIAPATPVVHGTPIAPTGLTAFERKGAVVGKPDSGFLVATANGVREVIAHLPLCGPLSTSTAEFEINGAKFKVTREGISIFKTVLEGGATASTRIKCPAPVPVLKTANFAGKKGAILQVGSSPEVGMPDFCEGTTASFTSGDLLVDRWLTQVEIMFPSGHVVTNEINCAGRVRAATAPTPRKRRKAEWRWK